MEVDQHFDNLPEENGDILSRLDEEKLGGLEFRALSPGLGFEKIDESGEELIWRRAQYQQSKGKNPVPLSSVQDIKDFQRGELTPFYEDIIQEVGVEDDEEKSEQEVLIIAGYRERILSFLVDIAIIVCASLLTLGSLLFFIFDMNINPDSLFFHQDMKFYSISIFIVYYLFYFSFMDRAYPSSPGKSLFSIRVVGYKREDVGIGQIFMRTILSLIDTLLIGLPSLFSVKEDLSETRVIKYSNEEK